MLKLIVFLGNPGAGYERSRHNAGWLLAEGLPFYGDLVQQKKFRGRFLSAEYPDQTPRHFLLPETYMNLSGRSVRAAAGFYKIPPGEIIAVHDELELPLGTLSLKSGGGLGGHNGLRSMKEELGTPEFWRLRIGIGRPAGSRPPGAGGPPVKGCSEGGSGEIAGWVLSNFTPEEEGPLTRTLAAAAELLARALKEGPEGLAAEWRKKRVLE
ncbi:MAG: aminoacyl-tRNA hydrolase [Treponema sp.]|nr:aminoacyl-tRNA hydrolase [Treponema sp.]